MVEKYQLGLLEDKGIIQLGRGKVISKKDIRDNPGDFPVYSSSSQNNGEVGTYGKYMFDDERITWSIDGGGILFYRNNHKYSVTNVCGWLKVLKEDTINCRYLYFTLFEQWQNKIFDYNHKAHPSIVRKEYVIPIPSLAEQKRIVSILDTFTASIDNLKVQIAQRRKQFDFYRYQLLDLEGKPGVEMIALKEVADIGTGSSNTNEGLEEGKYPFYTRGKEVLWKNEYEYDETSIITAGDGVGVGKVFHFVSGKFALHQRAYRIHIKTEEINPRFIYYYMVSTFETYIKMKSFFAAVTSVRKPMIFNYPIPKCSLSEQHRIVSFLDTFEKSIKNLEAQLEQRQKQYEYYRNQLLTFE